MTAEAVIYAGDLDRMAAFYEGCFGLVPVERAQGYCCLQSDGWLITLVRSAAAVPPATPPTRRSATPIKLAFAVENIDALRPVVTRLGGQPGPPDGQWTFRDGVRCDCLDPEGNVVQLIAQAPPSS